MAEVSFRLRKIAKDEFRFYNSPTRPPGGGGGAHRQFGGGCPVYGAPSSPPLGCAPADENPAGGAATSAPGAGQPEAVGAARLDAADLSPRGQENNTFFTCMFLNKLPRELQILLSKSRNGGHAGVGHQGGLLRCPQQSGAAIFPSTSPALPIIFTLP